jgi:hypothetical protein
MYPAARAAMTAQPSLPRRNAVGASRLGAQRSAALGGSQRVTRPTAVKAKAARAAAGKRLDVTMVRPLARRSQLGEGVRCVRCAS